MNTITISWEIDPDPSDKNLTNTLAGANQTLIVVFCRRANDDAIAKQKSGFFCYHMARVRSC